MTVTLCGSLSFISQMNELKPKLEALGAGVLLPRSAEVGPTKEEWNKLYKENRAEFISKRRERMLGHFQKIADSDAILVCNWEKRGIAGYIGTNTIMEIGVAFHLNKHIFLLFDYPERLREELEPIGPAVIGDDLAAITQSTSTTYSTPKP